MLQEKNQIGVAGAAGLVQGLKVNGSLKMLFLVTLFVIVCFCGGDAGRGRGGGRLHSRVCCRRKIKWQTLRLPPQDGNSTVGTGSVGSDASLPTCSSCAAPMMGARCFASTPLLRCTRVWNPTPDTRLATFDPPPPTPPPDTPSPHHHTHITTQPAAAAPPHSLPLPLPPKKLKRADCPGLLPCMH